MYARLPRYGLAAAQLNAHRTIQRRRITRTKHISAKANYTRVRKETIPRLNLRDGINGTLFSSRFNARPNNFVSTKLFTVPPSVARYYHLGAFQHAGAAPQQQPKPVSTKASESKETAQTSKEENQEELIPISLPKSQTPAPEKSFMAAVTSTLQNAFDMIVGMFKVVCDPKTYVWLYQKMVEVKKLLLAAYRDPVGTREWLWKFLKDGAHHTWVGLKLFGKNVATSTGIVFRHLSGKPMTYREYRLLIRTSADIFRMVPFSFFILVPAMEIFLPIYLYLFPGMLPSSFRSDLQKDDYLRKRLRIKIDMARFLREALKKMKKKGDDPQGYENFIRKVKSGEPVEKPILMKYVKYFKDEFTTDNLTRGQLAQMCQVMGLPMFGTTEFLRNILRVRLGMLRKADSLLTPEVIDSFSTMELREAASLRGMDGKDLRTRMKNWIDLANKKSVPYTILFLSRVFTDPQDSTVEQQDQRIKEVISKMPAAAIDEAEVDEEDVVPELKLEMIKEQQDLNAKEKDEEDKKKKAEEEAKKAEDEAKKAVEEAEAAKKEEELAKQLQEEAAAKEAAKPASEPEPEAQPIKKDTKAPVEEIKKPAEAKQASKTAEAKKPSEPSKPASKDASVPEAATTTEVEPAAETAAPVSKEETAEAAAKDKKDEEALLDEQKVRDVADCLATLAKPLDEEKEAIQSLKDKFFADKRDAVAEELMEEAIEEAQEYRKRKEKEAKQAEEAAKEAAAPAAEGDKPAPTDSAKPAEKTQKAKAEPKAEPKKAAKVAKPTEAKPEAVKPATKSTEAPATKATEKAAEEKKDLSFAEKAEVPAAETQETPAAPVEDAAEAEKAEEEGMTEEEKEEEAKKVAKAKKEKEKKLQNRLDATLSSWVDQLEKEVDALGTEVVRLQIIDQNQDGVISTQELIDAIDTQFNQKYKHEDIRSLIARFDTNEDGNIDVAYLKQFSGGDLDIQAELRGEERKRLEREQQENEANKVEQQAKDSKE